MTTNTANTANATKPKKKHPVQADTTAAAAAARREAAGESTDLAALRAHPALRAAVDAARRSFAKGEDFSGEELDARLGITDDDKAAGDAWLDEYERQLEHPGSEERERRESITVGKARRRQGPPQGR